MLVYPTLPYSRQQLAIVMVSTLLALLHYKISVQSIDSKQLNYNPHLVEYTVLSSAISKTYLTPQVTLVVDRELFIPLASLEYPFIM